MWELIYVGSTELCNYNQVVGTDFGLCSSFQTHKGCTCYAPIHDITNQTIIASKVPTSSRAMTVKSRVSVGTESEKPRHCAGNQWEKL